MSRSSAPSGRDGLILRALDARSSIAPSISCPAMYSPRVTSRRRTVALGSARIAPAICAFSNDRLLGESMSSEARAGGLDLESLERFAKYDFVGPPGDLTSKSGIILVLIQEVRALRTALRRLTD